MSADNNTMHLPEKFVERMVTELGADEAAKLCEALGEEPTTSVRLNCEKILQPKWECRQVPWSRAGYQLDERPLFTYDTDFHAGAYYVQEASSQFAGHVLASAFGGEDMCRGLRVLDVCAAPGGKSTHYASLVGEEGIVVANEINRGRAAVLADNARKWGLGNMVVTCNDSSHLTPFEEWFDAVAVDAPCSGEGMFRKSDDACEQWSEANVAMCAMRQWEILQNVFGSLKVGGALIYSTCTFNRSEDEEILQRMCDEYGDELCEAPVVAVDADWGVVVGRVGVFQTFRFFPHKVKGEGLFMAVALKAGVASRRKTPKARRRAITSVDRKAEQELNRWIERSFEMSFYQAGDTIYGCRKEHFADIEALSSSLSVIYSGVAMGQIFKNKLKPDGALALYVSFRRDMVPCVEVGDDLAVEFLRRHDIDATLFEQGLNLVVCKGQALGFVKRVGARVNNMYPMSLRILK